MKLSQLSKSFFSSDCETNISNMISHCRCGKEACLLLENLHVPCTDANSRDLFRYVS